MGLTVDAEPAEVGFDASRLARLPRHFARYVDDGLLPGWLIVVTRHGRVVHLSTYGARDVEAGLPVEVDTLFRIYSMTKPVTSVAAMMLYEEGAFQLNDPVSRFIPAFANARVYQRGSDISPTTVPAVEPVRIWHLLTHTSGLTYGFQRTHPVDAMHRQAGFEWSTPPGRTLAEACDLWAGMPLLFQPGTEWNYGVSTDVLGRVVEVAAGCSLDRFFQERIFDPIGMPDTRWWVDGADESRFAALYVPAPPMKRIVRNDDLGSLFLSRPHCLQGGGGLVSTAADYHRFTQMLLRGGELDGARLLSPRTVAYMTRNHLPGNADLETFGRPLYAETVFHGVGFGLGFSVVVDPAAQKVLCSRGEYAWGGAASTAFFVDPASGVTAMFFTQLMPSSTHPIRPQLRQLVYQSLMG